VRLRNSDLHLLTGVYAVDALEPVELEAFERHLTRCGACESETRGLRETAARLAINAAAPPPPAMLQRVMAATYETRQLAPATSQFPRAQLERPRFTRPVVARPRLSVAIAGSLAAVSLAVAIVLGVAQVRTAHQLNTAQSVAAVLAAPDAESGSRPANGGGTVTVTVSRAQRSAVVTTADLPPLPSAEVYQLWVMAPAGARSAGLIPAGQHNRTAPLLATDVGAGDRFGITVEPAGGTAQPTTTPLIVMPLPT
jgi:anti-sigma-K factor RskA